MGTPTTPLLYLGPADLPDGDVESALAFLDRLPSQLVPRILVDRPGPLVEGAGARGISVACMDFPALSSRRAMHHARQRLAELCPSGPVLVHTSSPAATCLARAALGPRAPIVWQLSRPERGWWIQVLARRRASLALASDPQLLRRAGLSVRSRRTRLIPPAVPGALLAPPRADLGASAGSSITLGMITTGSRECGASDFLQASKMFRRAQLPGAFLLRSESSLIGAPLSGRPAEAGSGPEAERRRSHSLPREGGSGPDGRSAFLDSLDVLVVPSRKNLREGLILEAMARGVTVVATAVPGVARLLETGDTGWLTLPRDPVGLFRASRFLAQNPMLAASLGQRARARAALAFPDQAQHDAILQIYRELLAPSDDPSRWLSRSPGASRPESTPPREETVVTA